MKIFNDRKARVILGALLAANVFAFSFVGTAYADGIPTDPELTDNRRNPGGAAYTAAMSYIRYLQQYESATTATNPSWYTNIVNKNNQLNNLINGINFDAISAEQMLQIKDKIGELHNAVRASIDETNKERMIHFDAACADLRDAYSLAFNGARTKDMDDRLASEVTAREAADATLQQNIDAEAQTRENEVSRLDTRIDNEKQYRKDGDNAVRSEFAAADAILQGNIDAETAAREAADATLQQNIDAEAQTRAERDAILQSNIEAEVNARIAAINAEKNARMAQDEILQNNIDLEAQTRFQADRLLQFKIDSEAEARQAGDAALDRKIMNESYVRQQADDEIRREMKRGYSELDNKINEGVAIALAVAGLRMPEYDPNHKLSGAIGYGNFHSANAIAVGLFYQFNKDVNANLSYSYCGSECGISAGVSFKF